MVNAYWSDRYGRRGLCAILMSLLALVGYVSTSRRLLQPFSSFETDSFLPEQSFTRPPPLLPATLRSSSLSPVSTRRRRRSLPGVRPLPQNLLLSAN